MLTAILFIIIFVVAAMLWNEGLWGNAITLVNLILAGLIATNYFEPLAAILDGQMASFTYFWDFLSFWLIFAITFGLMRAVTDKLSKTKVKFKGYVEHPGRVIFALLCGYTFMCIACMSIHLAPLPEHPFGGAFHQAQKVEGPVFLVDKELPNHFLGFAPDRQWLQLTQWLSGEWGALSRWTGFGMWTKRPFDPDNRFLFKYGARRRMLEQYNKEWGDLKVDQ